MTPRHVFVVAAPGLDGVTLGSHVPVAGAEARHGRVRRLRPGEQVDLVDGRGRRVTGPVVGISSDEFVVAVEQLLDEGLPAPRLVVVQALAKGERGDAAVEMLTECGVDEIVPWAAQRSVAVWRGDRAARGADRWRAVAHAAAKQSRRARIPDVPELCDTAAVADRLRDARLALVLHETAAARLSRVTLPAAGDVMLVVGPEGGISDAELGRVTAAGALPVRMGESVLRTSTAGVAAAAVVLAAAGRWD